MTTFEKPSHSKKTLPAITNKSSSLLWNSIAIITQFYLTMCSHFKTLNRDGVVVYGAIYVYNISPAESELSHKK